MKAKELRNVDLTSFLRRLLEISKKNLKLSRNFPLHRRKILVYY